MDVVQDQPIVIPPRPTTVRVVTGPSVGLPVYVDNEMDVVVEESKDVIVKCKKKIVVEDNMDVIVKCKKKIVVEDNMDVVSDYP